MSVVFTEQISINFSHVFSQPCKPKNDNIVRRILNPQGMEVRRGIYLIRLEISVTLLRGVFHTSTFG